MNAALQIVSSSFVFNTFPWYHDGAPVVLSDTAPLTSNRDGTSIMADAQDKPVWVYRLEHLPTGRLYFGITQKSPARRLWEHVWYSKRETATRHALHGAIRKHGMAEFAFEVVHLAANRDEACAMERRLIMDHGTLVGDIPGGFNHTTGGELRFGYRHSAATRAKMSAWQIGRKLSPESKEKMRLAKKGKTLSAETREKMSIAQKRRIRTPEHAAAISAALKGRKFPPHVWDKIRATKAANAAQRAPFRHTEQTKAKMSVIAFERERARRVAKEQKEIT